MTAANLSPHITVYKDASGQYCCARIADHWLVAMCFPYLGHCQSSIYSEMRYVSDCNPNALYPYASLHRTKEFSEAGLLEYCPECERAVLAALARIEGDYREFHHQHLIKR